MPAVTMMQIMAQQMGQAKSILLASHLVKLDGRGSVLLPSAVLLVAFVVVMVVIALVAMVEVVLVVLVLLPPPPVQRCWALALGWF